MVEDAHRMSPALNERMISERFLEHRVFIQKLLPQDLKLELYQMSIEGAIRMSSYLAYVAVHMPGKYMMEPEKLAQ